MKLLELELEFKRIDPDIPVVRACLESRIFCCVRALRQHWSIPRGVKKIWLVAHDKPGRYRHRVEYVRFGWVKVDNSRHIGVGLLLKTILELGRRPIYVELWY